MYRALHSRLKADPRAYRSILFHKTTAEDTATNFGGLGQLPKHRAWSRAIATAAALSYGYAALAILLAAGPVAAVIGASLRRRHRDRV